MTGVRSSFHFVEIDNTKVVIADDANFTGKMSVTNDAENVTIALIENFGANLRYLYYDTDGELTELYHDGKVFTGFGLPELKKGLS
jgi:hypothetical protein